MFCVFVCAFIWLQVSGDFGRAGGGGRYGSNLFSWFWEFVAVVLGFSFFLNKNLKVEWVGTGRGSRRSWGRGNYDQNIF